MWKEIVRFIFFVIPGRVNTYKLLAGAGFEVYANLLGFEKEHERIIGVGGVEAAVGQEFKEVAGVHLFAAAGRVLQKTSST